MRTAMRTAIRWRSGTERPKKDGVYLAIRLGQYDIARWIRGRWRADRHWGLAYEPEWYCAVEFPDDDDEEKP